MMRMTSCTIPPVDSYPDVDGQTGVEVPEVPVKDHLQEKTTSSTNPLMDINALGASVLL